MSRIYLIGMPGSGKSYFGNRLKEFLDYPFIDLDDELEKTENRSISEIFAAEGEAYFRHAEAGLLRSVSERHPHMILSTGGGTPCFHEGISYMNQNGISVFLQTKKEVLIKRLMGKEHRPLMQDDVEKKVTELLDRRMKYYQQAHVCIDHRDPNLLIELINKLKS